MHHKQSKVVNFLYDVYKDLQKLIRNCLLSRCKNARFAPVILVDKVFSMVNYVFQRAEYQCINVVIYVNLWVVVLHRKDAVQWKAQGRTQLLHLNMNNLTLRADEKDFCAITLSLKLYFKLNDNFIPKDLSSFSGTCSCTHFLCLCWSLGRPHQF